MINILPIEDKKEIKREYFKRLSITALFSLAVILLAAIIMLLPTMLLLNESESVAQQELVFINQKIEDAGLSQIKPFVDDINKKIGVLKQASGFRKHSETIGEIFAAAGSGVKISAFSLSAKGQTEGVVISGNSSTRKDMLSFIESLKRCKAGARTNCTPFDKVESPVSNLLKERDIDFSIKAEVAAVNPKK